MRNILFIVILFFTCGAFAQSVEEKQPTNYNSNTLNAPATITISSEMVADTVAVEQESKSKKSSNGALRTKSVQKSLKEEEADKMEVQGAAAVQSASQTFSVSKSAASQNRSQRTPSAQTQMKMDEAVDQLSVTAPESFEYHFYSYQAGNYNIDLVDHLNKAEVLRPNNSDVHIQKVSYHIIKEEGELAKNYLEKLKSSTRLSQDVISYTEDLLISASQNSTLITHGFDDGYGVMYHQLNNQTRADVQLISLDFLQSPQYRASLMNKGYVLPKREIIDVAYLKEFCELNEQKGISISTTIPKEYLAGISDKLFVTGLVLEYKKDANYDNFNRNEELWNSKLKKTIAITVVSEKGRQLSANYLPMLLHLRHVYDQKGEVVKKKEIDEVIDQIAVQSNKYEQVKKLKQSY
jgi:hypothetical protein